MRVHPATALLLLLASFSFAIAAPKPPTARVVASHRADLLGTGKKDLVQITVRKITKDGYPRDEYRLVVNGKVGLDLDVHGSLGELSTVDINRAEKGRDIELSLSGPSDQPECELYRFDGKRILWLANLTSPSYLGNGIVIDERWQGYGSTSHKYVQGKDHLLKEVAQEFYSVGATHKLKTPLALRVKRNQPAVVANLRVGSSVEIVLADLRGWCLVRTENGLMGWMREAEMGKAFGLSMLP